MSPLESSARPLGTLRPLSPPGHPHPPKQAVNDILGPDLRSGKIHSIQMRWRLHTTHRSLTLTLLRLPHRAALPSGAGRRRSGRRRAAQQRCGPASLARSSPSPSLRSSPSRRHPPPPASPGRLCARCRHQRCHPSRACRRGSCRQRWLSTSSSASVAVARSREAACLLGQVLRVLRTCARG